MECASRHHCLIYEEAPSRQLPAPAASSSMQTLSLHNPRYLHPERYTREAAENFELDHFINKVISQESLN
jgi:hypothetical protein